MNEDGENKVTLARLESKVDGVRELLDERTKAFDRFAEDLRIMRIDMASADRDATQAVQGINHRQTMLMDKQDRLDKNQAEQGRAMRELRHELDEAQSQIEQWRAQLKLLAFVVMPVGSVLTGVTVAALTGNAAW